MRHGFDTDDETTAVAALLVYAVWKSRDVKRFKVTPDVWGQVERFTKSAAKRATTLARFLEQLKPRLYCSTVSPRFLGSDYGGGRPLVQMDTGEIIAPQEEGREFLTRLIDETAPRPVLDKLFHETAVVILTVRERCEREKVTDQFLAIEASEDAEWEE
jgi:hypothetical protein